MLNTGGIQAKSFYRRIETLPKKLEEAPEEIRFQGSGQKTLKKGGAG